MENLTDTERAERLKALQGLMDLMRPAVQSDGGDLVLVSADVESGVERILKDRLPWVTEVSGGVTEDIDPFESSTLGQGGYVPRY